MKAWGPQAQQRRPIMIDRAELDELRAHIGRLESELDELRTERTAHVAEGMSNEPPIRAAVGRRQWMKAAAAAAVGGTVVALAPADRVAADDPNDLTLGSVKSTAGRTGANYTGPAGGNGFLFQSGTSFPPEDSVFPAALAGYTDRSEQPNGVYGFTSINDDTAHAIVGVASDTAAAATGVLGQHDGFGVGVEGHSPKGFGVVGRGSTGVSALGTDVGLSASGDIAAIFLPPTQVTAPLARVDTHNAGEIDIHRLDSFGFESDFWACVTGGAPGRWRKLAGPGTAGSLHPVDPTRVYDSRAAAPGGGRITANADRVVSVKDGRDLITGAVTVADLVPDGASAVAFNVTITQTVDRGFIAVTPGDATALAASTINWSEAGQTIANGSLVKLDDSRQIKVFSGPNGSAHVILDIVGYYL
jgi:hypothetical protein